LIVLLIQNSKENFSEDFYEVQINILCYIKKKFINIDLFVCDKINFE